MENLELASPTI